MIEDTEELDNFNREGLDAEIDPFSLLDLQERDPAKRFEAAQKCKIAILQSGKDISKLQADLLKNLSSSDLGVMKIGADTSNTATFKELALMMGEMLADKVVKRTQTPTSTSDDGGAAAPVVPMEALGDTDVKDWETNTDMPSISISDIYERSEKD